MANNALIIPLTRFLTKGEGRLHGFFGGITAREAGWGKAARGARDQEAVFDLAGITGIMKIPGGFVGEVVEVVQFAEQQATGIRGYPAAPKIGHHLPGEKAFKDELLMAGCFPKVSGQRSYLFGDFRLLAETLASFQDFL